MARRARGFTLIEVMVALAIMAIGVSALVASTASSAQRAGVLREREMGRWVASNHLTFVQVSPGWPKTGTKNTEIEMGNTVWYVRTKTQKVADPDLLRVDVDVRLKEDNSGYIYKAAGFVGNPEHRP